METGPSTTVVKGSAAMSIVQRVLRREMRKGNGCRSPASVPTANGDHDSAEYSVPTVKESETKKVNLTIRRKYFLKKLVEKKYSYGKSSQDEQTLEVSEDVANLVSSRLDTTEDLHAPAIDIDVPCRLVKSSTEGHYHLYIDVPMTWKKYVTLLEAMRDAGIVEESYVACAKRDGHSMLRKPGITKGELLTQAQEDLLELSADASSA